MAISWCQALAWRMGRQLLAPVGTGAVADVVRRLGAVPAWSGDPEVAVRMRRERSEPGEVDRALADGRLVKVFAFRGATHLMTPDQAGVHLALRAASRMWELPSWQDYYDLTPGDWPALRAAVRDAVAGGPLTQEELAAAVTARRRYRHLAAALTGDTFLKPFCWQGDVCLGPPRDGKLTVQALDHNPRWRGLPELDDAGRQAVVTYLSAYGPATLDRIFYWLGEGLGSGRKRIRGWLADLDDRIAHVQIDGDSALVLTEHVDELAATAATGAVRLLAGHDQWVLGPGTADPHVVPPERRAAVTRGANLVVVGGVVAGTWKRVDRTLAVSWFGEGEVPGRELDGQVRRLAAILDRPLDVQLDRVGAPRPPE